MFVSFATLQCDTRHTIPSPTTRAAPRLQAYLADGLSVGEGETKTSLNYILQPRISGQEPDIGLTQTRTRLRSHYPRLSVLPACPPYQLTSPVSRLTTVSIGAHLRPPSKLPYLSIPAARIPSISHSTTYIVPRANLHNSSILLSLFFFPLAFPPPLPQIVISHQPLSLEATSFSRHCSRC